MAAMFVACWSLKGGSGTTVVSAVLGLLAARAAAGGAVLVDLAGDLPAVLGTVDPPGHGVADWLRAGPRVPPDGWARLEVPVGPRLAVVPRGEGALDATRAEVLAGVLAGQTRPVVVDCGTLPLDPAPLPPAPVAFASDLDVTTDATAPDPGAIGPSAGQVVAAMATVSLLVTRPCYLALRRAARSPLLPSGVVLFEEPERALGAADVEAIVGAPVVARVPVVPAFARAVDAGLLARRLPRGLERALRDAA